VIEQRNRMIFVCLAGILKLFYTKCGRQRYVESKVVYIVPNRREERYLDLGVSTEIGVEIDLNGDVKHNKVASNKTIYQIDFRSYFRYLIELFCFGYRHALRKAPTFLIFMSMLADFKFYYYFKHYCFRTGVRVILNNYEGSSRSLVANLVGLKSHEMVSVNFTCSASLFPLHTSELNKYCDVFLAWGERQENLVRQSATFKPLILQVGYPFDFLFDDMTDNACRNIAHLPSGKKFVAVFDNLVGTDFVLSTDSLNAFYDAVIELLRCDNLIILLRSKKGKFMEFLRLRVGGEELDDFRNRVIEFPDKGDLGPGLIADAVFAFSYNTLGALCANLGKSVVFYDAESLISKLDLVPNSWVVKDPKSAKSALDRVLYMPHSRFVQRGVVDPFADGRSRDRIKMVIDYVLASDNKALAMSKLDRVFD
jgi:hypothetical protein